MAGALVPDNEAYTHFGDGVNSKQAPMSAIDKKILNFALRMADRPVERTHGQILRNFGMYPPEFWSRVQSLTSHPEVSKRQKAKLDYIFPDPSRPGPMGGGMPVKTDGKSFSHGTEW